MIRYIGAKNNLKNWLLKECPIEPINWVEPFGGMFSIFFTLDLNQYPNTRFIYNEINPHHLNLFTQLKKESFRDLVKSENMYKREYLASFNNYQLGGEVGALSWLRILCGSKNIRNILEPNYDGCWHWEKLLDSLDSKVEHLNRMEIENLNYDQCIQKWNQEETFFYLDPPYVGYEDYYTYHNFNTEEHQKLRDFIYQIKGDWILSYYNFPQLLDWYAKYSIKNKKVNLGTEYLIKKSE